MTKRMALHGWDNGHTLPMDWRKRPSNEKGQYWRHYTSHNVHTPPTPPPPPHLSALLQHCMNAPPPPPPILLHYCNIIYECASPFHCISIPHISYVIQEFPTLTSAWLRHYLTLYTIPTIVLHNYSRTSCS